MAEFAYFMTEEYLKENTPIDDNMDAKLLKTAMREAQDIYIRDLIGSGIYDELCTQITAGTVTADNSTLLKQYIQPCLKYFVLYESAQTMSFQLVNKGIVTRNSEWQSPADINSITALMTKWRDKGEYYAKRLQDYLCEYHATYPLFHNPGSTAQTIHARSTFIYGGLYLGEEPEHSRGYDKPV
jgi:hypothetical protein